MRSSTIAFAAVLGFATAAPVDDIRPILPRQNVDVATGPVPVNAPIVPNKRDPRSLDVDLGGVGVSLKRDLLDSLDIDLGGAGESLKRDLLDSLDVDLGGVGESLKRGVALKA